MTSVKNYYDDVIRYDGNIYCILCVTVTYGNDTYVVERTNYRRTLLILPPCLAVLSLLTSIVAKAACVAILVHESNS